MTQSMTARVRKLGFGVLVVCGTLVNGSAAFGQPTTDKAPAAPKPPAAPTQPAVPAPPAKQPDAKPKLEKPADLPTGEQVLNKFVEATGGKEAYAKLKNRVMTGSMELAMGMKAKMSMTVADGGKMLMKMELPNNMGEMTQGSDGETFWANDIMQGARILEGAEKDMVSRTARVAEEADWAKNYKKVECLGIEQVDGKPAYKVLMTPNEGEPVTSYYDQASSLLIRQVMNIKSPQGEFPVDSTISDYKKVGEILVPHKTKQSVMGQEIVLTVEKVEFNTEIPADKFALPKEIKELKEKKAKKAADPKPEAKPAPEAKPEPKNNEKK